MGIFSQLEQSGLRAGDPGLDDRYYRDSFGGVWASPETYAGFPIDPDVAMRVSTVFACNSLIAETIASLPCVLYRRRDDGGKDKATDHRVYWTLRYRPNSWMTPLNFFGDGQMSAGMRGNALAEIRDDGRTMELLPLPVKYTTVEQLANGRLRYRIQDPKVSAEPRYLLQDRVLHIRDLSNDGIAGMARAVLAREAIAVSAAAEAFVGGWYKNDATGRLMVKHPAALDEKKRKEFRAMIQENYAGWQNRAKAMLLTNGVTAEELGKHDDSGHLVDPRKFQVADIARYWRVPLFMIGLEEKSTSWGTGIEQQTQGFVDFTIKAWADRWTQALMRALLTEDEQDEYVIEFLFADLVRGDLLQRMQAYQIGRQIGMWSPDELRAKENEGPREDGQGGEYQQTPTGAAPNTPATPAGNAPPPAADQSPQAIASLLPVLTDMVGQIRALTERQQRIEVTPPVVPSSAPAGADQTDSGTRRIAAALRERIAEREAENAELRRQNGDLAASVKAMLERPVPPIEVTVVAAPKKTKRPKVDAPPAEEPAPTAPTPEGTTP